MTLQTEPAGSPLDERSDIARSGWRFTRKGSTEQTLSEVYASVPIPVGGSWLRRLLAFAGPGYMISVGYMDPGNWATDLCWRRFQFGYTLLFVIMLSNLMARSCFKRSPRAWASSPAATSPKRAATPIRALSYLVLFVACELAIIACDLAEVIGTAIALQLLFGIPLIGGALITALDAFLVLLLMNKGFRFLEAFIISLRCSSSLVALRSRWWRLGPADWRAFTRYPPCHRPKSSPIRRCFT